MVVSGQAKVGKLAGHALVGDQDVLRLQVSVVDPNGMAIFNSIQDLEEGSLGKSIITDELTPFSDV